MSKLRLRLISLRLNRLVRDTEKEIRLGKNNRMQVDTAWEGRWDSSPLEDSWRFECPISSIRDCLLTPFYPRYKLTALAASLGLMNIEAEDNMATMDNICIKFVDWDLYWKDVSDMDVTSRNRNLEIESWVKRSFKKSHDKERLIWSWYHTVSLCYKKSRI